MAATTMSTVSQKVTEVATSTRESVACFAGKAQEKAQMLSESAKSAAADPQVQVTAVSALGGAATLGTAGCATGAVTGGVTGAVVGLPAALFTLGLSIPVCAAVGAVIGAGTGATVGGTTGAAVGGVGGYYGYQNKEKIVEGVNVATSKVGECQEYTKNKLSESAEFISGKAGECQDYVRAKVGRASTGGSAEQ